MKLTATQLRRIIQEEVSREEGSVNRQQVEQMIQEKLDEIAMRLNNSVIDNYKSDYEGNLKLDVSDLVAQIAAAISGYNR